MRFRNSLVVLALASVTACSASQPKTKNFVLGKWVPTMEECSLTYLEFTPSTQTTTTKTIGPYPAKTETIDIHYNTSARNQVYVWGEGGISNAVSFFYVDANHIRADDMHQCVYKRK